MDIPENSIPPKTRAQLVADMQSILKNITQMSGQLLNPFKRAETQNKFMSLQQSLEDIESELKKKFNATKTELKMIVDNALKCDITEDQFKQGVALAKKLYQGKK